MLLRPGLDTRGISMRYLLLPGDTMHPCRSVSCLQLRSSAMGDLDGKDCMVQVTSLILPVSNAYNFVWGRVIRSISVVYPVLCLKLDSTTKF